MAKCGRGSRMRPPISLRTIRHSCCAAHAHIFEPFQRATVASKLWPFRRRPVGKFRNSRQFAATRRRPDGPSTWPCLQARRAPRRWPALAAPCAAPGAAPSFASWLPETSAHLRVPSSRYRIDRRSRADVSPDRSPRCATRPASLQSGQRCARRTVAPAAVCHEMASSSTSWSPHNSLRATGGRRDMTTMLREKGY
jgi:hypothetical protein